MHMTDRGLLALVRHEGAGVLDEIGDHLSEPEVVADDMIALHAGGQLAHWRACGVLGRANGARCFERPRTRAHGRHRAHRNRREEAPVASRPRLSKAGNRPLLLVELQENFERRKNQ